MHKLTVKLPPFSPDYSGVCSALFELGGLLLIHDASGCTGNYTGYDEPRWYGAESKVFCTALREIDAVLGNDDKLVDKAVAAAEELNPRFIGIMGSPVPTVIGADLPGIAMEIEARCGIPSFGFGTTGLQFYDVGVSDSLMALSRRFLKKSPIRERGTINLLGATPLDFGSLGLVDSFKKAFEYRGFKVKGCFSMGSSLDELIDGSSASVNLVLSASGYGLAKMLTGYGIPFVVGQPIGDNQADLVCGALELAEKTGESVVVPPVTSEDGDVLIIAEHVTAHSLATCLRDELGVKVQIGCPFMGLKDIWGSGTFALPSERSIEEILRKKYRVVIGDPLYGDLMDDPGRLIPLPHVAVSSKLHWNDPSPLVGEGLKRLLKGVASI